LGITVYELRNSQLYNAAHQRANELADQLGLPPRRRPGRSQRLFSVLPIWHDLALAIIYSSTLGGWALAIAYAGLHLARCEQVWGYDKGAVSAGIAIAVAALFAAEMLRLDHTASGNRPIPSVSARFTRTRAWPSSSSSRW
jgi:hypothetical protein